MKLQKFKTPRHHDKVYISNLMAVPEGTVNFVAQDSHCFPRLEAGNKMI